MRNQKFIQSERKTFPIQLNSIQENVNEMRCEKFTLKVNVIFN